MNSTNPAGGVTWPGVLPGRDEDVLGVGVTWITFADASNTAEDGELIVEVSAKLQLLRSFSIKPDFQYVHGPTESERQRCALGAGLQVLMDF